MTPTQREILDRRYIEDATLTEIARAVGTSVPAVSQRLATVHRMAARMAA
jgi:DNA-directed RNA polymerase specialized sigma24 family protein